jgi:hypothetical protein
VVTVEQQVPFDSLPDAVKAGLQARAGAGQIIMVETLTERDRPVVYEAHLVTAGRRSEIKVGPDGKPPEE